MDNDKIITEKKKTKINAVDIIMIVIAAAGIIAAVYFGITLLSDGFDLSGIGTASAANVEYGIKIDMVDTSVYSFTKGSDGTLTCPFLKPGDALYDAESGKKIGEIVSLTYVNSSAPTGKTDSNGKLLYSEYPDHIDVTINVSASAAAKGEALAVNGFTLRTGAEVEFRTSGFTGKGVIVRLSGIQTGTEAE